MIITRKVLRGARQGKSFVMLQQSQSDLISHRPGFQSGLREPQITLRAGRYATLYRRAASNPQSVALSRRDNITGLLNTDATRSAY